MSTCACKRVNAAYGSCMGQRLTCEIQCWQQRELGGLTCYDKAYRSAIETKPERGGK